MTRKMPLTNKVLRGLEMMVVAVEADTPDVVFACDSYDDMTPKQRRELSDVERACAWVRDRCSRVDDKAESPGGGSDAP